MGNKSKTNAELIAPCGMNCGVCIAHLREKNKCSGCRVPDVNKPITRVRCKIKTCKIFKNGKAKFCFECENFPCDNLNHLDKRYRTKYKMSMIENLENIKALGIKEFVKNENARWTCSKCSGTICVHKGVCVECGEKINN
jgi:hypothetical protein